MTNLLEVIDKSKRIIFLTRERYKHILKHPEMQNKIQEIIDTLENPLKITDYCLEKEIKYYYRYHKERKSKAKYMIVIVKYLNGKGFIITAYFTEAIK
ncbi:hypothetical protein HY498_00420 [Candidatus Woesearchaeota archaeon]|nr:hypothetical protein [Candidatus Woesearchaeota archaeon]